MWSAGLGMLAARTVHHCGLRLAQSPQVTLRKSCACWNPEDRGDEEASCTQLYVGVLVNRARAHPCPPVLYLGSCLPLHVAVDEKTSDEAARRRM
jgi:hypothetical protein